MLVLLHHVGAQQHGASRNSSRTVHEHIGLLALGFDEVVGWLEGMLYFLHVAVVQVELLVLDVSGVFEAQVDPRADCSDVVLLEFLEVVGEIVAADPDLSESVLGLQHLLPLVIKSSKKHLNYYTHAVRLPLPLGYCLHPLPATHLNLLTSKA